MPVSPLTKSLPTINAARAIKPERSDTISTMNNNNHLTKKEPNTMHILVTNDDGVTAPGLLAVEEMSKLGLVSTWRPTATGRLPGMSRPWTELCALRGAPERADHCLGQRCAPSDCVALAMCGFITEKSTWWFRGSTRMPTWGTMSLTLTVTAAMEAAIGGLPAIAISLEFARKPCPVWPERYRAEARIARVVSQSVLRYGLAPNVLLNVQRALSALRTDGNPCHRPGSACLPRQARPRHRPARQATYYWTAGDLPRGKPERGRHFGVLAEGYVSVTPMELRISPTYQVIPDLNTWEWETDNLMRFCWPRSACSYQPQRIQEELSHGKTESAFPVHRQHRPQPDGGRLYTHIMCRRGLTRVFSAGLENYGDQPADGAGDGRSWRGYERALRQGVEAVPGAGAFQLHDYRCSRAQRKMPDLSGYGHSPALAF